MIDLRRRQGDVCFRRHCGVCGREQGMMLTAVCIGFTATLFLNNIWIGLFCAILAGGTMALLHAFLSVTMITNQIISGTVINILAVGLTGFRRRSFLVNVRLSRTAILPIITVYYCPSPLKDTHPGENNIYKSADRFYNDGTCCIYFNNAF